MNLSRRTIELLSIVTLFFAMLGPSPAMAAGGGSCMTPASGMVSWWKGNSNALDIVSGYNGALQNGAGFSFDGLRTAFSFDGVNDLVRVSNAPGLKFTTGMTVETWVKPARFQSPANEILSKWDAASGSERSYTFKCDPSGRVVFSLSSDGGTGNVVEVPSTNAIPTNQWSHLAATYDGSSVKVYVNGALQGNANWNLGIYPGNADLGIGGALIAPSHFTGAIDELSLYNRALSQSDILSVYFNFTTGKCDFAISPVITEQPVSQTIPAGSNVTFSVVAAGTSPLTYFWSLNGSNIAAGTSSTITLGNVQASQAGFYNVLVSNFVNTAISSSALLTVLTPSNSCAAAPTGMVSWWKGEGNGNDSADSNSGTFMGGAATTNGLVGQAFRLNGSSAFVQVPDAPNLRFTNAMTTEAWIFSKVTPGQYGAIITKWDGGVNQRSYSFAVQPSGTVGLGISSDGQDNGSIDVGTAFSAGPIPTNQWVHVCGVYDGTAIKLYVNGALHNSTPWTQGIYLGTVPLSIGSALVAGAFFNGMIDEPAVYNRALSSAEIAGIYNAGAAGKCGFSNPPPSTNCVGSPAGLVDWWRGEGNAADAADGLPGVLVGGTTFTNGKVGQAFVFDGVQAGVSNAVTGLTNIQNNYTMEFWAWPTLGRTATSEATGGLSGTSGQRYAIFPMAGGAGPAGPAGVGVSVGTNGVSVFEHGDTYLPSLLVYNATISGWTHIAVVYSNQTPRLYINGTLARTGIKSTWSSCPSTYLAGHFPFPSAFTMA